MSRVAARVSKHLIYKIDPRLALATPANTCVSTAQLGIQADGKEGSIRVHALDQGDGPILFSIASLRTLGAIVDFSEDLIVFRKLTDRKVIQLERSVTGHQLIPMTSDWYEQAQETARPVPTLRDFIYRDNSSLPVRLRRKGRSIAAW